MKSSSKDEIKWDIAFANGCRMGWRRCTSHADETTSESFSCCSSMEHQSTSRQLWVSVTQK